MTQKFPFEITIFGKIASFFHSCEEKKLLAKAFLPPPPPTPHGNIQL
jgi:hypothetical protein